MHNYFNGRGTFGFTCDVCGRELNTCSIVNGMKFCAKCYQETFGKDNQQNEIQQLKQQLVEKQNKIDEISKEFVQAVHAVYDWRVLCAEKDKEIKKLNWQLKDKDFIIKNLNHSLSVAPNANAGQRARIDELTKIVEEKDQRIAELEKDLEFTTKTANELIEIKHKLEQELAELKEKTIVVPVKLGDTIYVIPSETNYRLNIVNRREDRNKVYKYLVDEIRYNKYGFSIVCDVGDVQFYCNYEPPKNLCGHFDTEKYYGETWFTTEQEAQEKLKEMKRNG